MKAALLSSTLLLGLLAATASLTPVNRPAFCKTVWLFSDPCDDVSAIILRQIQAFNPLLGCEKCRYMLQSASPFGIKATHTSPDGLQVEIMEFSFSNSSPSSLSPTRCQLKAKSVSLRWDGALEVDRNYCNIYDLVSASGLLSTPGAIELTNEFACRGYVTATCRSPQDP